jgi:hypothetical protein
MAFSLPPHDRRRPRRGSLDRPVNGRLYRAAFLLAVIPVIALALTVHRPLALPPPELPPTFDQETTVAAARELATLYPDRTPGSAGATGARQWVTGKLESLGYEPAADTFEARLPGVGKRTLANIVAIAPGRTPEAIVISAHRDNSGIGSGANDNASGTAALLELARSYGTGSTGASRVEIPDHTIVFLSTDGGAAGSIGAARFAADPAWRDRVLAVVNLDAIGGTDRARIDLSGEVARSPAASLVLTAAASLAEQTGREPRRTSPGAQLIDLAFPFSLYDQAPFVGLGIPAVTLTTSGLRPHATFEDTPEALDADAIGTVGRAAQQLVEALDQGLEIARGTSTYLWLGSRVVSGWAIQLLLVALLLPFLAATVDLFARCRRLHVRLGPALRALRSRAWLWLWVGALFEIFRLAGAWPGGEPRPVDPASPAVANWDVLPLALFGGIAVASWLIGKGRLQPHRAPTEEERLAGYAAVCLGLGLIAILSLAINPYAVLFLLPSLHCWLWLAQARDRRAVRLVLLVLGLAGPAVLLASFAVRFELGWDAPWYLVVLAGVGKLPIAGIALALAWCAALAQLAALESGRYAPYPRPNERGLGPGRRLVRGIVLARRRRLRMRIDRVGAPARRQGSR